MGPAASTTRMPTHAMANPAGSRSGPRRSTVPPYASARPMLVVATPEKLATPTTNAPMKIQRCGQMKNVSRPIERCHDVSKNTPVMMDRPPTAAAARNTAGRFRIIPRSILSGMGLPLNRVVQLVPLASSGWRCMLRCMSEAHHGRDDPQAGLHRATPGASAQGAGAEISRHGGRPYPPGHRPGAPGRRKRFRLHIRHGGARKESSRARRPRPAGPSRPQRDLDPGARPVLSVTPLIVLEAARGARDHGLNYWDAQLWATARLNQIPLILTEDFAHGRVLEGV